MYFDFSHLPQYTVHIYTLLVILAAVILADVKNKLSVSVHLAVLCHIGCVPSEGHNPTEKNKFYHAPSHTIYIELFSMKVLLIKTLHAYGAPSA